MGNKVEYELTRLTPNVESGYSGNPLDPGKVHIDKALGRYGAVPPFFIPRKEDIITQVHDASEIKRTYAAMGVVHSQMPLHFSPNDGADWIAFPLEPLVSISGKNIIIRRNTAKPNPNPSKWGSIKECWSQDDYNVTIQGVIIGSDKDKYPRDEVARLRSYFDGCGPIAVNQEVLLLFNILYLTIESVSFPHTKGMNNQNFEIKAFSDNKTELLKPILPINGTE